MDDILKKTLSIIALMTCVSTISVAGDEFFYCGFTNTNGSGQDYAKWGKGTDFKFNGGTQRWEWITEYTDQYIYPDGRYVQRAKVSFFNDEAGKCNGEMEKIYKKKLEEITNKYK